MSLVKESPREEAAGSFVWEGRRQTILFKFTFTMKDFSICVSMALIQIYISLSSFLHL